ncbi:hypothetical protein [Streptomyces sp. PsTaAH-124]|uniref:hypothetical protein n=1 Tax=Streptomyces sp. PsTaAH-124 TaxID=1157638 RepID=UPI0003694238|nr:hypothetical protein [Streptomyces sp. PsTaAH-124]
MKINSRSGLAFMERIQREVTAPLPPRHRTSPFDDVYCTSKLTEVWHRAQQTSAYASLGPFSTRAFLDLPATSKEDSRPGP